MGTSSAQRSPATPEWDRVRRLYQPSDADPRQIASRIVTAMDSGTRQEMAGPGVAHCLSSLLRAARQTATGDPTGIWQSAAPTPGPAALHLAQTLRVEAERQIVAGDHASRFADLGLNALGTCGLEVAAGGAPSFLNLTAPEVTRNLGAYGQPERLPDLAVSFLAHDFDHLFRYFVTRDLSDFIGHPALPDVSAGSQLRDAVTRHCQETARRVTAAAFAPLLEEALATEAEAGLPPLQQALTGLTTDALEALRVGGAG